jgi:ElaB/YqjD/DUF883 family membrane-anchored ribosome-binding protein
MEDRYNEGSAQWSASEGTTAAKMKEQVAGKIDEVKEKAREFSDRAAEAGRRATERVDAQREPAARTLEATASRVQERGDRIATAASGAARTTAEKLQATADYLREHDVHAMLNDAQDVVRRHPGQALAAAAVAGFLIGKAFSAGRD